MKIPGMSRAQEMARKWEENLTWEQIVELEEQGSDVKEIKKRFLIKQEEEEKLKLSSQKEQEEFEKISNILRFTNSEVSSELILNKTSINKLESWLEKCKDPNSQIVRDTIGKPPLLFGKSKWTENVKTSEILYASVVQCHPQLWKGVTEEISPAIYLLVYSLNPKYIRNIEVLKLVSKHLNDFREVERIDKSKYSKEMNKLYEDLDNPESTPHIILDSTLLSEIGINDPDANIRLTSGYVYGHTPLPNNMLPSDGILPFIRFREKNLSIKTSFSYATRLIPFNYYK